MEHGCPEFAVAFSQVDIDIAVEQIRDAVAIHVGDSGHASRQVNVRRRREASGAVAEIQQRVVQIAAVRGDRRIAAAGDGTHHETTASSGVLRVGVVLLGLEGAITVAQQHGETCRDGYHQI